MTSMNKVVLITGAASGIGEAIAYHFAKKSAKLSLFDVNFEGLKRVSDKCESSSKMKVLRNNIDIRNDRELKQGIESTIDEFRGIDVLVNCAGIFGYGGILKSNCLDVYDRICKVNLRAVVATSHFAAPALIKSKGCIVNISSVIGKIVRPSEISYSISKAAVIQLTKCVALELADAGVRVNCVLPGAVKTELLVQNGISKENSKKLFENLINCQPLKHCIAAEELAELVAFLASDNARSITGAEYLIDAGFAFTPLQ